MIERRKEVVPENRRNPLLFERDGAFNPGWLLFIEFSQLGAACIVVAIMAAAKSPEAWPAIVAAISFLAFAMLCTAIIVVPLGRAKILATLNGIDAARSTWTRTSQTVEPLTRADDGAMG